MHTEWETRIQLAAYIAINIELIDRSVETIFKEEYSLIFVVSTFEKHLDLWTKIMIINGRSKDRLIWFYFTREVPVPGSYNME